MIPLARECWVEARARVSAGRAGRLFAPHLLRTGRGEWWVDRWPEPAAMVLFVGGNLATVGDASRISPESFATLVDAYLQDWDRLFIDAPADVLATLGPLQAWPLLVAEAPDPQRPESRRSARELRVLRGEDGPALSGLDGALHWIGDPWGGLDALAQSGRAWGAWQDGRLAAISAPGFVGDEVEDVFVVTEAQFRGRGLSPACAGRVLQDVAAAGRRASWTTWPANRASRRVAEKLGFSGWNLHTTWIAGEAL